MKKKINMKLWMLVILSAILLSIPYTIEHAGLVSLIALIPLFTAEYIATQEKKKFFFIYYYLCFFIWNIITTYWIWFATEGGAIAAIVLNALQMALIFRVFRWIRKRNPDSPLPYFAFASLWLCWEHFYHTWQVSWPWLTLGNSFASSIRHIQWYDTLGTLGGSLWIILANILIFRLFLRISQNGKIARSFMVTAILVLLPIVYSHIKYYSFQSKQELLPTKEVAILQPNIDPYNEKFNTSQSSQNQILVNLIDKAVTPNTYLTIAPETFFNPSVRGGILLEDFPTKNSTVELLKNIANQKGTNIIFGAVTYLKSTTWKQPNKYSVKVGPDVWKNVYNSAVYISSEGLIKFYHKSKLVILAESVPYIGDKRVFESLGIDLGGGIGNFTPQQGRYVFKASDQTMYGTAICYESVFGDFFRGYILNGADFMTIITNDGWWRNTFGHIQHLNYARLRAIETRRSIARSANTGISAIIYPTGDIVEQTGWWQEDYITAPVVLNKEITPFVKYGDLIGLICSILAIVAIFMTILQRVLNFRKYRS